MVQNEQSASDWGYQLTTAENDAAQLGHQVAAAQQQAIAARRDLDVLIRQQDHQEAVSTFLTGKFTGAELYRWLSGRLSATYFQAYGMAHDMAMAAERAYQFERGRTDGYIRPAYWESRHNGLQAGESLGADLERMAKAYLDTDARGLEIIKKVSLLDLDPLAVLRLHGTGRCEFALTEALYDADFPGHYARRLKTVSVTFETEHDPIGVNATLTQLGHKTVLEPDPRAVAHLMDPKGSPPATIRADWRTGQQIALSDLDGSYRENNGLFDLRYDDDRYLPFEGTGAVSTWRLELPGGWPDGMRDVTLTVRYTAEQGGEVFATAVRGLRKPHPAARFFDLAVTFPEEWQAFLDGQDTSVALPFTPEMFPGMVGRQITGVQAVYEPAGAARVTLNGDRRLTLEQGTMRVTPGLGIAGHPSVLTVDGDKTALENVGLMMTYRAGA